MHSGNRQATTAQQGQFRRRDTYLNNLKSRLKENLKTITENYESILYRSKLDDPAILSRQDPYTQAAQENFELSVRSSNIVNACESITRLVSEIKQLLILGDFCWLEEAVRGAGVEERTVRREELDAVSTRLRDLLADDLFLLEEEMGTACKTRPPHVVDFSTTAISPKLEPPL